MLSLVAFSFVLGLQPHAAVRLSQISWQKIPQRLPCIDPSMGTFRLPAVPANQAGIVPNSAKLFQQALRETFVDTVVDAGVKLLGPLSVLGDFAVAAIRNHALMQADAAKEHRIQEQFESIVNSLGSMVRAQVLLSASRQVVSDHAELLNAVNDIITHQRQGGTTKETYLRLVGLHDAVIRDRAHWLVDNLTTDSGERAFVLLLPASEMAALHIAVITALTELAHLTQRARWQLAYYDTAALYATKLFNMMELAVAWRVAQYKFADGGVYREICESSLKMKTMDNATVVPELDEASPRMVREVRRCVLLDSYMCTEGPGKAYAERTSPCMADAWSEPSQLLSKAAAWWDPSLHSAPTCLQILDARNGSDLPIGGLPAQDVRAQESYGMDRVPHDSAFLHTSTLRYPPIAANVRVVTLSVQADAVRNWIEGRLRREILNSLDLTWRGLASIVGCSAPWHKDMSEWDLAGMRHYCHVPALLSRFRACLKDRWKRSHLHIVALALESVGGPARVQAQNWDASDGHAMVFLQEAGDTGLLLLPPVHGGVPNAITLQVLMGRVRLTELRADEQHLPVDRNTFEVGRHILPLPDAQDKWL